MPARAHLRAGDLHFEREIDGAARPILRRIEIRQRRGVALRTRKERRAKRSSASIVTTQGEMLVAKLLPRNGPSGWYSHACMSRADQSLTRQTPKM